VTVRVFVEGGGPHNKTRTECRKAFHLFFEKFLGDDGPRPRVSACGSRDEAYRDFCRCLESDPETLPILLVDSEEPVAGNKSRCAHLRDRDKWTKPMPETQAHLMVQCMESWFFADCAWLQEYYGQKFRLDALPGSSKAVEAIPKRDLLNGLARATKGTAKGEYHKTRHGFEILGGIDPFKVRDSSSHARGLLDFLQAQVG
jgi:hypothetical protein